MSDAIDFDSLCIKHLAALGAITGAAAGLFHGPVSSAANAAAGGAGAYIGSKKIGVMKYQDTVTIHAPLAQARVDIASKMSSLKALRETVMGDDGSDAPAFVVVVGGGTGNMNPCVLCVQLTQDGADSTNATLTAGAKEGLIKQHTAEKVVKRTIEQL